MRSVLERRESEGSSLSLHKGQNFTESAIDGHSIVAEEVESDGQLADHT